MMTDETSGSKYRRRSLVKVGNARLSNLGGMSADARIPWWRLLEPTHHACGVGGHAFVLLVTLSQITPICLWTARGIALEHTALFSCWTILVERSDFAELDQWIGAY